MNELFYGGGGNAAGRGHTLSYFLIGALVVLTILAFAAVASPLIRHVRRGPSAPLPRAPESTALDLVWTAIPVGIAMSAFVWGLRVLVGPGDPPGVPSIAAAAARDSASDAAASAAPGAQDCSLPAGREPAREPARGPCGPCDTPRESPPRGPCCDRCIDQAEPADDCPGARLERRACGSAPCP